MLEQNKFEFDSLTSKEALDMAGHGGRSNESYIIKTLKAKEFRQFKGFTEVDEEFLKAALRAFQDGVIPKNTSKKIKDAIEIKSESAPLKVLAVLRRNLSDNILADQASHSRGIVAKEVILSEYLIGKVGKA